MTFFGLRPLDASILLFYVVAVLAVGRWLSHQVKGENDFFLAGRKLGKWFQFFLNFGNMTDPGQATVAASSVYRQGASGGWIVMIPLLMSPAYWFLPAWYRRVRLTTTADLFDDRFGKRFLASLYAVIIISVGALSIGLGNIIAFKTLAPIMVKPVAEYTAKERQTVADYGEFAQLRQARQQEKLGAPQTARYETLKDLYDRGFLLPYVSYLSPLPFYLSSSSLIAIFLVLGGLQASALVDGLQAVLTIIVSFILVPFGLHRIGGLHELHRKVPEVMFLIFGGANAGEYTWYSIAAFLLVSVVGTVGATASMAVNGSATTELAARLGAVTGGITKRFVTIAWCMCGLIAVALFGPNLSDPDQTWGLLTRSLLPLGMIGLMIVGILGGKLAYLGANSIGLSALVVRNVYRPLLPGKSDRHYMIVARVTIPVFLLIGVTVAVYMGSVVALTKFMIVILVLWGAPIFLIFKWRRLTDMAVRIEVIACLFFIAVIPLIISSTPVLRQAASLTVMTTVSPGSHVESVPVFFEEVVHLNPGDLNSPREGLGHFNIEVYLLSLMGMPVRSFTPAGLLTARYVVDALLPLILLIVASYFTRPADPERVSRFYARMKTPVLNDPAADAAAVQASYADPARFDHTKLFPSSNWEFTKWDKLDTFGFLACCASVGVILLIFKAVLMLGS